MMLPAAPAQVTPFNASTFLQTSATIGSTNDSNDSGQIPGFGDLPPETSTVNAFGGSSQSLALAQLDLSGDVTGRQLLFVLSGNLFLVNAAGSQLASATATAATVISFSLASAGSFSLSLEFSTPSNYGTTALMSAQLLDSNDISIFDTGEINGQTLSFNPSGPLAAGSYTLTLLTSSSQSVGPVTSDYGTAVSGNFTVSSIPEPSTVLLVSLGGLLMALKRSRGRL